MITELLLLACFSLYGTIAVYDLLDTYNTYGTFIDDGPCKKVYYSNLVNCILGCLLSVYIIAFLLCQCLCNEVMNIKMNFSLTKCLAMVIFVGVNIWNAIQLSDDDSCYTKYKIKAYSYAYIILICLISVILLCYNMYKKRERNYE